MKKITRFWEDAKGLKTYAIATAMFIYSIGGFFLDLHDANRAVEIVFIALGIAGVRHGVTTEQQSKITELIKLVKKLKK